MVNKYNVQNEFCTGNATGTPLHPAHCTLHSKKVIIGMSGGVDSSLTAALLKQQGYDVIGVVIKVWREDGSNAFESMCADAQRVCASIDIPYHIVDMSEPFRREVIEYFVDEYQNGRTPNPCAKCNPTIKFKTLIDMADKLGAQYIATGHYAKLVHDAPSGRWLLYRSPADKKDQTYFLYGLTQDVLSRLLLPLGDYEKSQVRQMARDLGLPVAQKPDSQEICFLQDGYADFIARYTGIAPKKGNFIDIHGNVLGTHMGIIHYTVGQRKGLGTSFGKPMFVLDMDAGQDTVTLGEAGSEFLEEFDIEHVNLISCECISSPTTLSVKTRHGAKPALATVSPCGGNNLHIAFDMPARAVTPGQIAMLYDGDLVVGGGVIV